jgi:hypothetical protein
MAASENRDFRNLSQQELDEAYDQRCWAPNMSQVLARYDMESERLRAAHP